MHQDTNVKKRPVVHVTAPDTASGSVGHLTVFELQELAAGSEFEANCPKCGMIHLNRQEIEIIEKEKFTETESYNETVRQVEFGK